MATAVPSGLIAALPQNEVHVPVAGNLGAHHLTGSADRNVVDLHTAVVPDQHELLAARQHSGRNRRWRHLRHAIDGRGWQGPDDGPVGVPED